MSYINHEQSFIASVQCHTPGFCGFWDCAELAEKYGAVERRLGDWLTLHNLPQDENHLFRFDCHYDDRGYVGYNIESYSKSQGRAWSGTGLRFGFTSNGYIALYPVKAPPTSFWKPMLLIEGAESDLHGRLHEGVIEGVRVRSPDSWTLKALKREYVGDYWHVYANDADGPTMELSLHIHRLGYEDLDDH